MRTLALHNVQSIGKFMNTLLGVHHCICHSRHENTNQLFTMSNLLVNSWTTYGLQSSAFICLLGVHHCICHSRHENTNQLFTMSNLLVNSWTTYGLQSSAFICLLGVHHCICHSRHENTNQLFTMSNLLVNSWTTYGLQSSALFPYLVYTIVSAIQGMRTLISSSQCPIYW